MTDPDALLRKARQFLTNSLKLMCREDETDRECYNRLRDELLLEIDAHLSRPQMSAEESNPFLESLPLTEAAVAAQVAQTMSAEEVKEACAKVCKLEAAKYKMQSFEASQIRGALGYAEDAIRALDLSRKEIKP